MMKLKRFRVTNFRSVEDSGWIETDDVTALIGTNESGKTNVLLPLWKFNPAKEGEIVPTADYPRKHYNTIRDQKEKPDFIRAVFELDDALVAELAAMTGSPPDSLRVVEVSRDLDGLYGVTFPDGTPAREVDASRAVAILEACDGDVESLNVLKSEEELRKLLAASLKAALDIARSSPQLAEDHLRQLLNALEGVKTDSAPKTSAIVPRHRQACDAIRGLLNEVTKVHPDDVKGTFELITSKLPKFVYYSTYGNLDSEIYLPHVIQNMERKGLGLKEQAKVRTLKVLFEFVKLHPKEILELGKDFREPGRPPTDAEIAAIAEKKKERSILLQSAQTLLTARFREWWKQGEYRFRFEADGDHFRIWVSDDRRPEEIELEGRSTGLQWFLSFYLVFLVERADAHEDAILLLDEPGLSLHPLAQRDLSEFFDGLAKDNQLIYTCHSPFLIDADRLERARKVYVSADGTSKVTADLRATADDSGQKGAAYAVHAAVGLTVAESLLLGCTPVVVEGVSDQHYLTAMKSLLIASGKFKPRRELVFPPAGGAKGVKVVSSILGGRDEEFPVALCDSDAAGRVAVRALRETLYVENPNRVLEVSAFVAVPDAEVEDLIPPEVITHVLDRWHRPEHPFAEVVKPGLAIVPQIEAWARDEGISLPTPGWKVELARRVKQYLLAAGDEVVSADALDGWAALFATFER